MSVLDPAIELVSKYREMITGVDISSWYYPDDETKDRANELWDSITAELATIPPGHTDLDCRRLTVRGFGFPFRSAKLQVKSTLPDYSREALVRDILGWNRSIGFSEANFLVDEALKSSDPQLETRRIFAMDGALVATPENPVIYVDLETTGPHPAVSEIIEFGAVVDDGTSLKEHSELFDVSSSVTTASGELPFADCHHITPEMIAGKRKWSEATDLHELLANPEATIVAHHIFFEAHWFAHTVPDFMRLRSPYFGPYVGGDKQPRMFDSRMAAAFVSDATRGTLESLVEFTGEEYVDAHRALADVRMMRKALLDVRDFAQWI